LTFLLLLVGWKRNFLRFEVIALFFSLQLPFFSVVIHALSLFSFLFFKSLVENEVFPGAPFVPLYCPHEAAVAVTVTMTVGGIGIDLPPHPDSHHCGASYAPPLRKDPRPCRLYVLTCEEEVVEVVVWMRRLRREALHSKTIYSRGLVVAPVAIG
jgi:hypothetical protein